MAEQSEKKRRRLRAFFGEVKDEGRRVTWPTREKAKQDVLVVLACTALIAGYVAVLDLVLSGVYTILF